MEIIFFAAISLTHNFTSCIGALCRVTSHQGCPNHFCKECQNPQPCSPVIINWFSLVNVKKNLFNVFFLWFLQKAVHFGRESVRFPQRSGHGSTGRPRRRWRRWARDSQRSSNPNGPCTPSTTPASLHSKPKRSIYTHRYHCRVLFFHGS